MDAGRGGAFSDHPRSRGVYVGDGVDDDAVRGSSPLARGLPEDHGRRQPRRRIIPARAGFTIPKPEEEDATTDHPRSRGVYPALTTRSVMDMGSSPLARGLQCRPGNTLEGGRIIPARAGFTGQGGHAAAFPWDHPRSRGVYPSRTCNDSRPAGSSPLARGLLLALIHFHDATRHIPARAGGTCRS